MAAGCSVEAGLGAGGRGVVAGALHDADKSDNEAATSVQLDDL